MKKIQATATFPSIPSGSLAEFEKRATELIAAAESESGTLQYDWFMSQDKGSCVVRETYADSDAVLAHLGHVGEMIGPLVELGGGLELEVFGDPTPALAEALAPFAPTVHSFLGSK